MFHVDQFSALCCDHDAVLIYVPIDNVLPIQPFKPCPTSDGVFRKCHMSNDHFPKKAQLDLIHTRTRPGLLQEYCVV
jgi:hypothetical protein